MSEEFIYVPSVVPVFPLPGIVLFPHTILPLHVFEPRYRALFSDALEGEKVVAIAQLKPGWEPTYHTFRTPIYNVVGIGKIVQSEQLEDGDYNVLLRGVGRATIISEINKPPYRRARIEPVETFCSANDDEADRIRGRLFEAIRGSEGIDRQQRKNWLKLRELPLGLDECVDLLAAGIPADPALRQCVLAEPDAAVRADIVLRQIETISAIAKNMRRSTFPSGSSMN